MKPKFTKLTAPELRDARVSFKTEEVSDTCSYKYLFVDGVKQYYEYRSDGYWPSQQQIEPTSQEVYAAWFKALPDS